MIANIQLLRAFAAINVVIFHLIITANGYQQSTSLFNVLQGWGQNGVDIFFVISGFIMLHTQLRQPKTPWQFLRQRLIRIVPLYWLFTLLVVCLLALFPAMFRDLSLQGDWVLASFFFSAQWFTDKYPVVFVGWTLEWEMLFYLLFGCALWLKALPLMALTVTVALFGVALQSGQWMLLEFCFGMLAAWIYATRTWSVQTGLLCLLVGAWLLSLSLLPVVKDMAIDRTLSWGLPAFLLVLGAAMAPQNKTALLQRLGDASYSLYLLQILTIPACYKLSSKLLPAANPWLLAAICMLLTLLAALACHQWLEQPMLRWLRQRTAGQR